VDILQAPAAEHLLGPFFRLAHGRRVGHAAADAVAQVSSKTHDLAAVIAFVGDAVDGVGVDRLGALAPAHGREQQGSQGSLTDVAHRSSWLLLSKENCAADSTPANSAVPAKRMRLDVASFHNETGVKHETSGKCRALAASP
jgi:hypothetical protein